MNKKPMHPLRTLLIIFGVVAFLLVGKRAINQNRQNAVSEPQSQTSSAPIPNTSPPKNPFGLMFSNTSLVPKAKEMGVHYYRPTAVSTTQWNGSCSECDAAINNGLTLILTVRNENGAKQASSPPVNIANYEQTLSKILDKYSTPILVIENEENSQLFYTGSPQDYHKQLKAGCDIAHAKAVKCTNGGLVSELVALLVTDDFLQKGQTNKADNYLKTTLGTKIEALVGAKNMSASKLLALPKAKNQITKGKELLSGYKADGADYVNFHWYVADTDALAVAKEYLEQSTGLPAMTNEVGQQNNTDPTQVTAVMQKIIDLKLPVAVWFSVDISGYGQAKSLLDPNGSLRPSGVAFENFIATLSK